MTDEFSLSLPSLETEMRQEIAVLTAERDALKAAYARVFDEAPEDVLRAMREIIAERDALRAQVARLQEALKEITEECRLNIDCNHQDADDGSDECTDIDDCIGCTITKIAEAALKEARDAE